MRLGRRTALLGALAAASRPAAATAAACEITPAASVPVQTTRGIGVVTVLLNNQPAPMVLDTGAERSVLTAAAVTQYHLPLDEWVGSTMTGADGRIGDHRNANLTRVTLGGALLTQRVGSTSVSLPVVAAMDIGTLAGLLGADLLHRFDLDLDLPAGRFGLFRTRDCQTVRPPWSQNFERIPVRMIHRTSLLVPVKLDGVELTALIDTGAGISLINARGLHRLGLTPERLRSDPPDVTQAIGGAFPARQHRFARLQLGSTIIADPTMLVASVVEPAFDLLLGFDVLRRMRVWISYAASQLSIAR